MSNVFNRNSLLSDLRRFRNELNITPDDPVLLSKIKEIEDKLREDELESVFETTDNTNEVNNDKKEVLEKEKPKEVKVKPTKKKIKATKKKKVDTGASVRGIPQPLMNKVRARVPYATNNKDAIVCFLAHTLEDYENLSDEQKEVAKSIEKIDPFSSIATRLNGMRDRQIEMEKNLNISMIATAFLSLRNMGLETNSYRNNEDIKNKLLSKDVKDFIEVVNEILNDVSKMNNRSESSDIHINRR